MLCAEWMGSIWYKHNEDGSIEYTETGFNTYAGLFERGGVDIRSIKTVAEHKEAIGLAVQAGVDRKTTTKT